MRQYVHAYGTGRIERGDRDVTRPVDVQPRRGKIGAALTEHPGALGSFRRLLQVCRLGAIDRVYVPRLLAISMTSLLSAPLRVCERIAYGRRVRRTSIVPSPVFVLGHWRSGTTHLQNLICQDKNLAYLSAFHAIAPGFCLIGRGAVRRVLARAVEPRNRTRPMDNVSFSLDAPQEEELALANMTAHSFAHAFVLPQQAQTLFRRYVMFDDLPEAKRTQWIAEYLTLLQKVTLAGGGKRLVLKNCTNTARIPMLLKLFPNAKFIHIHRNPYAVFVSTMHLHKKLIALCQLQRITAEQVEANVLTFYQQLMRKFLSDRAQIPQGNLVEVRYEDLEREPLRELHKIYQGLSLPSYAAAEPLFRSYVESLGCYKKNKYELDSDVIATVNRNWQFAFAEWGYERR